MPGNVEIGNGYGVPGGGAYYSASNTDVSISSKTGFLFYGQCVYHLVQNSILDSLSYLFFAFSSSETSTISGHRTNQHGTDPNGGSEHNSVGKELPEYLKQKLKARGILKDDSKIENHGISNNVS